VQDRANSVKGDRVKLVVAEGKRDKLNVTGEFDELAFEGVTTETEVLLVVLLGGDVNVTFSVCSIDATGGDKLSCREETTSMA
jgi:hypothetical protein